MMLMTNCSIGSNLDMSKVLFIISTLTGGGAERTVSNLSQMLPEGIQCDVLLSSISEEDYPFKGNVITLGLKPKEKKTLGYQIASAVKRWRRLKAIKAKGQYDIYISFMESANFINIITGNKTGKVYVSVRNNLSHEYKGIYSIIKWVAGILYKHADKVISVSRNVERDLISNIGVNNDKCITIYNGHSIANFYNREKKDFSEAPVFITMGRLTHQKGQWHLIRSFSLVQKSIPNAKLIILGQGELAAYLKDLVSSYGLKKNVKFCGFVEDTVSYLRRADCFVLTSLYEGLCNAVIEAIIQSCTIIACNYEGINEIIAPELTDEESISDIYCGKYGVIVPKCSSELCEINTPIEETEVLLAQAMINYALGKYSFYTSERLKERAEYFDISHSVLAWSDILGGESCSNWVK